jgi:4-amino-4-deoxy-L-arabinose transferase-like glycosyltransferase
LWRRHEGLVCLAALALWLGATGWLRPLAIPDEGRYVGVAWEMLRHGDWLVPMLDGLPFFHKPPLFYWITAASMQLFGPGVWAARAAPWLGSVAVAAGLFGFVRRWVDAKQAWSVVVVLATLPIFYGGAQYANLDMLVAGCIGAAILLAAHAVLAHEQGLAYRRALALAFAVAACGVLAKGLIGVVLPALVMVLWGAWTRRAMRVLALLLWAPGWVLFLALAAPWFLAMNARFADFEHYFFVVQHLQRFSATGFNNPQPAWFYPALMLLATLPWSPWLLGLASRRYWLQREHRDVRVLMLVWVVVVTLFFSIPQSKLVGYILPAIPPLAFLIADAARFAIEGGAVDGSLAARPRPAWWRRASTVLAATGCVAMVAAAHFYQPKSQQALAAQLRAAKLPGDALVFVGRYDYDVAFYARLNAPIVVVDAWAPAEVAKDSWRRELTDAARFAPAGATRRLLRPEELGLTLCQVPTAWIVADWPAPARAGLLTGQAPVYRAGSTALWRIDLRAPPARAVLRCAEPG